MTDKVTVVFDLWGQRCKTVFDVTSELDHLTWILTCADKGFLFPIEVFTEDGVVLYDEARLTQLLNEHLETT